MTLSRVPVSLSALLLALFLAPTANAQPRMLEDSTVVDRWTLANGLRVVTHHVPHAASVAVTVGVPIGSDADPAKQPGLGRLAAETQMMAAAGDVPARTRVELGSLRPLGWSIKVTTRYTLLSEVASTEQLPGVLRQVAARLRGVTPTDAVVRSALADVRRDLGQELFGEPQGALHHQVRAYAAGLDTRAIVDLAAARALEPVRARDLQTRLRREFVPAHAVLSLAGDLSRLNLRALIDNEFGSIPAGDPLPVAPAPEFRPSLHTLVRTGIGRPIGVVAVRAPALTDSLHPQFFLSLLVMAQHSRNTWPAGGPIQSPFNYSILDEPDLVRFYPPVPADSTHARVVKVELDATMATLMEMIVPAHTYEAVRQSVLWMLGGPMAPHVLESVRRDGSALNYLCNARATRELSGGDAFWDAYLDRFGLHRNPQLAIWGGWVTDPRHQAILLFTPR